jgi:putative redox protein
MTTTTAHIHRNTGILTTMTNGRHAWMSDVPKALGSQDAAPGPHDLLDSALAACTVMTIELYLRRKNLTAEGIHCAVERVSEEKGPDGKILYKVKRVVSIDGDFSAEDRQRLIEIANKCPIHRLMQGTIEVETVLDHEL